MSLIDRRVVVAGLSFAAAGAAHAQTGANVRHHGVLIRTPDLDAALAFYCDGLGFPLGDFRPREGWARLAANMPIYLDVAHGRLHEHGVADVGLTFRCRDLAATTPTLRASGATLVSETPRQVAVGSSLRFADNAGIVHYLLQPTNPGPAFAEPSIYNCGFHLPVAAIAPTRALLEQGLGFVAMTERYFPPSIPYLEADRSFGFMLHHHQPDEADRTPRADARADDLGMWQVFVARDLTAAARAATTVGATPLDRAPRRFAMGRRQAFTTPGGGPFEIWSWA